MAIACRLCLAAKGLKADEIQDLPVDEEEFFEHLRIVHGIEVKVEPASDKV